MLLQAGALEQLPPAPVPELGLDCGGAAEEEGGDPEEIGSAGLEVGVGLDPGRVAGVEAGEEELGGGGDPPEGLVGPEPAGPPQALTEMQ